MKRRIKLLPTAEDDLDSSRAWYEKQRSGLGDELVSEVEAELGRLALHPEHHPPEFRQVRRAKIERFSHIVIYRIHEDEIHVLAILHSSRSPRVWRSRA